MRKRPANPVKNRERILDIQDYLKYKNKRDYVLFALGISTGYRAGDLVKLKVRDIKEAIREGYFTIMESKKENCKNIRAENRKPRTVKVVYKLQRILKEYIKDKRDYEYLFQSRKGINEHITVAHVSRILRDAGHAFGLRNITAHSMRKTYAYRIYIESKCNIVMIKEMLGHSDIETTKRYLGLDRDTFDKYSDTLNGILL
ncbi:tyrosine-type recombinase/integrase [Clostridium phage CWou-2020a]|uniref:Integrase n=1 Tax=Clostridium botulinum C/D str. DC5 TaxID=1443128 RepID=A0A0A0IMS9_CLOBO|nr:tyrosine-type recombinase/integrase [Clostridium botulinum]QPW59426.1 tyrosine-type recombinase/integrase [Clostridium phage CWou-2020a]KGN00836.1 integrase [Clostridium botulinum C/D str. DC5]KOC54181.1 integrase [Clostridium botulinum]KOC56525.1 integrase [Clostridium botulinum]MCD3240908.1 tyrosine-type recombinase/integrase [Clostridium botulinum D/C]